MIKSIQTAYKKANYKLLIPVVIFASMIIAGKFEETGGKFMQRFALETAGNIFSAATGVALYAKGKKDYVTE
jgi:hypothetical protein